jgi:hypothetical protein
MTPFVPTEIPGYSEFLDVANCLSKSGWSFGIFGGAARDIFLRGAKAAPRDFDLVVIGCPARRDLRGALSPLQPNVNGLKGFSFKIRNVSFDVWRLEDTWAFGLEGWLAVPHPGISDLLKTTFFNIEQIVYEFPTDTLHTDPAFHQAFKDGLLELNCSHNPFPLLATVRCAAFAKRYNLLLGPKLEDWILEHYREPSDAALDQLQMAYYGRQVVEPGELKHFIRAACAAAQFRR